MRNTAVIIMLFSVFSCQASELVPGVWEPGKVDFSSLKDRPGVFAPLDGPWKYTLKQFLGSEGFRDADLPDTSAFSNGWGHFLPHRPYFGALSASVVITLPEPGKTWGLLLPDNYTAYSLYANGRLVTQIGHASLSPAHHRSVVRPESVMIQVPGRELELILYNSNQEMFNGGFLGTILLGQEATVLKEVSRRTAGSLFTIGIIATVGVLYLLIFFLNVRIRYTLYFGLLSLIVAFRMALMDQRILVLVTDMPFPLESDLEYGAVLAAVAVLGSLLRNLFPKAASPWPFRIIFAGHGFFAAALVLLPVYEFAQLFVNYAPLLLGSLLFYLYTLLQALRLRLPGSGFFLVQILFLGGAGLSDFTNSLGLHGLGFHFAEVFLIAVIVQALWMAIRRSLQLEESQKMSRALQDMEHQRNLVMDNVAKGLPDRILGVSRSLERLSLQGPSYTLAQQKLFNLMQESHHRLESLVDDLRSFLDTKTDQGPRNLLSLDLGDMVREVSSGLAEKQYQQRLNIQIKPGAFIVKSDPSRLRVALKILLLHLLRLKPGNAVMVETGRLGEGQVWLSLTLMNHWWQSGQLPDLFSPFAGEPEAPRSLRGSILDLPLAKEYLSQAGGRLEAVNQGPGARFSLVLAAGDSLSTAPKTKTWENLPELPEFPQTPHLNFRLHSPVDNRVYRLPGEGQILAVDDEPINLRLLSHQLAQLGWSHQTAESGLSALEKIHSSHVGLVLLDVMMPVVDGMKVLRELRMKHSREVLPVVLVTAKSLPADRLEGLNAGANAYVVKPFSQDQLKVLLTRLVRRLTWLESGLSLPLPFFYSLVLILPAGHPEVHLPLPEILRIRRPFSPAHQEFYLIRSRLLDAGALVRILETQDFLRDLTRDGILKNWGLGVSVAVRNPVGGPAGRLAEESWNAGGQLLADEAVTAVLPAFSGLQVSRSPGKLPSYFWEDP